MYRTEKLFVEFVVLFMYMCYIPYNREIVMF